MTITDSSVDAAPVPPPIGAVGMARWAWRQLTSMRTALILLFLLALGAIPGSLIPQRGVDPVAVVEFRNRHPELASWYDKASLFEVFSSPWFSAIYLLLMVSLIGCLVPRTRVYLRAVRARPPATPRNLERLPEHRAVTLDPGADADPETALATAAAALRRRRFRVETYEGSISAERGYLRDTGNLVFHLSLVVVLVGIAVGHLYGMRGSALVVEGQGFSNTVTQYDNLRTGPRFDVDDLSPFTLTLKDFQARYEEAGNQRGAAREFEAKVTVIDAPGSPPRADGIRVNHPLNLGGSKVFLGPHGYAPAVTVRDGNGNVVFAGAVPFLPVDPVGLSSRGVVKVPDAAPTQLGFQGFFLPTAAFDLQRGPFSTFPEPRLPRLVLNVWSGDLGLDDGVPQSVYRLDTTDMTQVKESTKADAQPLTQSLAVGDTMTLPGLGSLTFDGYREWVVLQVAEDPGRTPALAGGALALAGLLASLFVRPRRVWVRARRDEAGRTVVEVAALARSEGPDLAADVDGVVEALKSSNSSGSSDSSAATAAAPKE
ncbi:cytochrome c biogenesis protein ResB [Sporichthya sp.]|uniref:cytochrome c biogenesis protein ResB n=1 Tax=Sporichthya sp. TaxID=65475 RepID=UPI00181CE6E7|nr:cytochrome c biogenesis protein ResB [Sporichthya sp.]MBA3744727.1 cytochrome c biogenesis protein ResB [Sporichthya sp.]